MYFINLILFFSLWSPLFFSETAAPAPTSNWSQWNKYPDCPGLEYRTSCLGQSFEGSKFHKLQIEIINGYDMPVTAEIMIVDDFEMNVSETHKIRLSPGFNKKLSFTHVVIPCMDHYDFKIFANLN